ncbi:MAG: DegT/DnrJ/EryC1/StrS family aminotransferase [Pirellulaceae bacterium]
MHEDRADGPLAIHGGRPAFPDGPPSWPLPDEEVRDILMSSCADALWGRYIGPFSGALCNALQELHHVEHVLPCCSGTFAVELALRGVGVRPGDEVILAGYDFPGNFRAIEAVGAIPVLVDIDPRSWCLDAHQIAECASRTTPPAIGSKTRALIVSHLHGGLADMQQLTELARQHGVAIVEDACQAPGALVAGRVAGTWGDVGVLSFGGSKLLSAGRGGAILTQDPYIYQRAKIFMERGNDAFPLSELQAAVLLPQIRKLPQRNAWRHQNVQQLLDACQDLASLVPVHIDTMHGTPSFNKVAFHCALCSGNKPSSAHLLAALQAEGLDVGAGFRGFLRRAPGRCRSVGPLTHSASAALDTLLLHHPILLQPPDVMRQVAFALQRVIHWWDRQPEV